LFSFRIAIFYQLTHLEKKSEKQQMLTQGAHNSKSENNVKDLDGMAKALLVGFSWSYAEIYEKQKRQEIINKNDADSFPSQSSSKQS
jgi:hypothetical protein